MSTHDSFFNGDVTKQCEAGTYPQHRETYVKHLEKSVKIKHLSQDEADKRLTDADALWKTQKEHHKKK